MLTQAQLAPWESSWSTRDDFIQCNEVLGRPQTCLQRQGRRPAARQPPLLSLQDGVKRTLPLKACGQAGNERHRTPTGRRDGSTNQHSAAAKRSRSRATISTASSGRCRYLLEQTSAWLVFTGSQGKSSQKALQRGEEEARSAQ